MNQRQKRLAINLSKHEWRPTKSDAKRWVKALESGEYTQGRLCMHHSDGAHCCLGVWADVNTDGWWEAGQYYDQGGFAYGLYSGTMDDGDRGLPPEESMPTDVAEMFATANDQHGLKFEQIAEVVREVWL